MSSTGERQATIELPCGYVESSGAIHVNARIREMGWQEEMALGTSDGENPMDQILSRCVLEIGEISDPEILSREVIPNLLWGDYETLLIQVIILTLGKTYEFVYPCPSCRDHATHVYDLSRVRYRSMPNRMERLITWKARSGHELVFRHICVRDAEPFAEIQESKEDQLGKLLALHLVSVDGDAPERHVLSAVGENPMSRVFQGVRMLQDALPYYEERERIRVELKRRRGGPDVIVESRCKVPTCRATFRHKMPLDPTLLLPHVGESAAVTNHAATF